MGARLNGSWNQAHKSPSPNTSVRDGHNFSLWVHRMKRDEMKKDRKKRKETHSKLLENAMSQPGVKEVMDVFGHVDEISQFDVVFAEKKHVTSTSNAAYEIK